ncbi:MAG: YIP1 family protein [Saccharofermentanales bacterium]
MITMSVKRYISATVHPISFFMELWDKKSYSFLASIPILAMLYIAKIMERQTTGFAFNYNNLDKFNAAMIFVQVFGIFFLWSVVNWAISTLFDGKAKMKEIWIFSSIALIPYTMSLFISVIMSNLFVPDEGIFLEWVVYIGIFWSASMLLIALMIIHDYSFGKVIWSSLASFAGIMVVLFMIVLVFSLFQQIYGFIQDIVTEIFYILTYERM